jgi:hypothetical protein
MLTKPENQSPEHGITFNAATGIVERGCHECRFSPLQLLMLECLLNAWPGGLGREDLYVGVYGRDGTAAPGTLRSGIHHLRRKLRAHRMGFDVVCRKGVFSIGIGASAMRKPYMPRPGQAWPAGTRFFVFDDATKELAPFTGGRGI